MASLIAILDLKGISLIQRTFRDDVPGSAVQQFLPLLLKHEENQQLTPAFTDKGVTYMHIRFSSLHLLAITKWNANVTEILLFLHRLSQVLVEHFNELSEESIRDNFVIIYELMDEMMDFGYPQVTESAALKEYITQRSYKLHRRHPQPVTDQITRAVSWRKEGLQYKKNEAFLDVIENVDMQVNSRGNVVRSEIHGAVKMKCFLSGMPELRMGLNDKIVFENAGKIAKGQLIDLEDVTFHQCVRLSHFANDRTISFIPPDGDFELMSYRIAAPTKPLIWVEASVNNHGGSRVTYVVKCRAQFKKKSLARDVEICVPVSDDVDSPKFKAAAGTVRYAPEKTAFVWSIKQLRGGHEYIMRAQFGLPTVQNEQDVPGVQAPISVKFEVPSFTISGIQVRYLKILEKSGYQAHPWVKYLTQSGDDYSLRTVLEKGKTISAMPD